ncbi:hypothetical protein SCH01S_39_01000 [Sphingomonas changbaiensis NBRC 104936]|uniref:DUF885 domain-containing protein n=1 Tax=Sphingomonas changbaiensis NBRC 104936 TaxID=1219043 RepID=A0A0E9MRP7_9SPHN|nr:DUF885 family protein [Sphingomonas changbaiensis]GAO39815.1 hypothetical protein SCH01S_39_01000 [Sphingomonas changbaiensis NBRC 104936]
MSCRPVLLSALALAAIATAPAVAQTPPAAAPAAQSADARLRALYDAEWAWRQKEFARESGDAARGASSDHFPRVDAATQEARQKYWRNTLAELDKIPVDQLSHDEQINAAVFRTSLEAFVSEGKFRTWEMPFNADSQFWSSLNARNPYPTADEYQRYLGRMRDIPRYFDEQIANMRAGLKRGFSVPRASLEGRDATIAAYIDADPSKNPFYDSFAKMPSTIPAADQERLQAEARQVIAQTVAPAYQKLLTFYRTEYLPKTRTTLAAEAMPDGKAFYQAQIKEYTTTDLTPEQIHEIGLKEVARITAEMEAVKAKTGFTGDMPAFLTFLRTDPQFYAKTPDELLGFSAYVAKQVDGQLKYTVGFLPRYRFTIIPVPAAIAPTYTSGRGGLEACMMNTYDLPSRPLYQIPALTLHECNPGHSFQAAVALEAPNRPAFRRQTYFSGYGEGWGLYTEWLGTKMGIYRTPYEDFGRLSFEIWRACRLVIDTGIHHYGWTRQQAIDYLASHTALAQHDVETEVDRYISWPGQALAYKLGELTIKRMRAKAEKELGSKFDQRAFHDAFLSLGSVPLPVLESELNRFIADGGKDPVTTAP